MVNQQNYDEVDRRLFGRPGNGGGRDWVEVVDDGSGEAPASGTGMDPAPDGIRNGQDPDGIRNGQDPAPRRLNPYFCAAWAVTGLMLMGGLLWFTGVSLAGSQDILYMDTATGVSNEKPGAWTVMAANLEFVGIVLLPFGLVCAFTLLAIHAVAYRSAARR